MTQILYEISGVTILAITSYIYQGRKHTILNLGKDALIVNNIFVNGLKDADNDVSAEFFFNVGTIHLKSFLSLIAINGDRGWSSFLIHLWCFLIREIYSGQQIQMAHTAENILFAFTIVPTTYDLVYIIAAADNRVIGITAFALLALAALLKAKQLHSHLLVTLQTWFIVSAMIIAKHS